MELYRCKRCGLPTMANITTQKVCDCPPQEEPKKDELVEAVKELTRAVEQINIAINATRYRLK